MIATYRLEVAIGLIDLVGISKYYQVGTVEVRALDDVELHVADGEFVVVLGPSGSGKTTLLNVIGALDTPTAGSVSVGGRDITTASRPELFALRRETVSFIFQSFNLFPGLTALENVEFGVDVAGKRGSVSPGSVLESVGLGHRTDHFPHELSGGEQQRVAIARALATGNPVLLADEPTGELDFRTGGADTGTPDRAGLRRPCRSGSHPQQGDIAHRRQGRRDEQRAHHQRRPARGRQDTALRTALVEVAECWH